MVNIKVPLGQSLTKFPNIKRSIPEFSKKAPEQATSDLSFLKIMADTGRLVFSTDNTQGADGSFAAIIPQNGETFYFLGGSWNLTLTPNDDVSITLRNDGSSIESVGAVAGTTGENHFGTWKTTLDSLIGNGTKAYDILYAEAGGGPNARANIYGYILPSETLSSRGG